MLPTCDGLSLDLLPDGEGAVCESDRQRRAVWGQREAEDGGWVLGGVGDREVVELKDLHEGGGEGRGRTENKEELSQSHMLCNLLNHMRC